MVLVMVGYTVCQIYGRTERKSERARTEREREKRERERERDTTDAPVLVRHDPAVEPEAGEEVYGERHDAKDEHDPDVGWVEQLLALDPLNVTAELQLRANS